ncbi:hypothetical protein CL689_07435 [Candidatus Saccharibacteria bacterium]|nr:hypothetical protein [Candidatus Saccharibacteria bacterium]MBJ58248.1 hypothetical protein [Candidatus Saccharibacteria bacterium]MBQ69850.1 hypothetical protein [Candidatus Saccharibacteria bacterium]|tara:strand:- start:61 stop:651 length:591 start_codon:yes stop_codon:yes gene_type:complete
MAIRRAQQIGIWIIVIALTVGTIASFVAIVLANENDRTQQIQQQEEYDRMIEEYTKQQEEAARQNAENSEPLEGYSAEPFDASSVTELRVDVLREGDGQVVSEDDTINASYFGWISDGTIFDSTNKKDADNVPIDFSLQQVIEGWTEGLSGQKVGSVVKLTIPADQAYGDTASGVIPANAPLQFIVIINSIVEQTE